VAAPGVVVAAVVVSKGVTKAGISAGVAEVAVLHPVAGAEGLAAQEEEDITSQQSSRLMSSRLASLGSSRAGMIKPSPRLLGTMSGTSCTQDQRTELFVFGTASVLRCARTPSASSPGELGWQLALFSHALLLTICIIFDFCSAQARFHKMAMLTLSSLKEGTYSLGSTISSTMG